MKPAWFFFALVACGGAQAPAQTGDLVIGPVVASASTPLVAPSPSSAPTSQPPRAPAEPIAARVRDELLAGAPQQASGGDLAKYQDAIDYERRGDLANARKAYYELITQSPSSPLVPYAYLAFGELFFAEGENDPSKLPLAVQAYEKATQFPPPANRAYAYAFERRAACMVKTGDHARALADAKKAIDALKQYPTLPLADDVAASARKSLIDAYVAAGQPDRAYAFLRAVDAQSAPAMIVLLGQEYLKRHLFNELLAMYDAALGSKDPEICRGASGAADVVENAPGGSRLIATSLRKKHGAECGTP